jgi:hypothetical protein
LVILAAAEIASTQKIALVVVSSIMGILFAVIGFRTQRIEGVCYTDTGVAFNEYVFGNRVVTDG